MKGIKDCEQVKSNDTHTAPQVFPTKIRISRIFLNENKKDIRLVAWLGIYKKLYSNGAIITNKTPYSDSTHRRRLKQFESKGWIQKTHFGHQILGNWELCYKENNTKKCSFVEFHTDGTLNDLIDKIHFELIENHVRRVCFRKAWDGPKGQNGRDQYETSGSKNRAQVKTEVSYKSWAKALGCSLSSAYLAINRAVFNGNLQKESFRIERIPNDTNKTVGVFKYKGRTYHQKTNLYSFPKKEIKKSVEELPSGLIGSTNYSFRTKLVNNRLIVNLFCGSESLGQLSLDQLEEYLNRLKIPFPKNLGYGCSGL